MVLALAAIVAVAAIVAATAGGDPPAPIPRGALLLDVGSRAQGRPVAPGFIGFSIEYPSARLYSGPTTLNGTFVALVRNLTAGGSPVLRIGGDTSDWTWWPTPGVRKPGGVRITLGRGWIRSVHAAAAALNARLILGVNFESDSSAIARTEANAFLSGIGRPYLLGFELGNEPEVYGSLAWYVHDGVPVTGRPHGYGFVSYLRDFAHISAALPSQVPMAGPASGAPVWIAGLSRYLRDNPRVRTATFHRYPLHRCFTNRGSPTFPTIHNLLSPVASSGPATSLAGAVAAAHARHIPFRVDELNSVSCGGAHGVSDAFASALWVLDTLFQMAHVGVDGVNIHTFHKAVYEPFDFTRSGDTYSAQVKPMYYGLLAFAQAAPAGARLLPTVIRRPAHGLRTWATRSPGGNVAVVLINESARRRVVAVRPPVRASSASVTLLRAPSLHARGGVTLGGQSFGSSTTTGTLSGSSHVISVPVAQGGRFVVRVPPDSAALLTLTGS